MREPWSGFRRRPLGAPPADHGELSLPQCFGLGEPSALAHAVKILHEQPGAFVRHRPERGDYPSRSLLLSQRAESLDLLPIGVLAPSYRRVACRKRDEVDVPEIEVI